jgi:hypothetical protein
MADPAAKSTLIELARNRFGSISTAEEKLFEAALGGSAADCGDLPDKDRIIRGDGLSWLCADPEASAQVNYRGVSIIGAEIVGSVNLEWAKFHSRSGDEIALSGMTLF